MALGDDRGYGGEFGLRSRRADDPSELPAVRFIATRQGRLPAGLVDRLAPCGPREPDQPPPAPEPQTPLIESEGCLVDRERLENDPAGARATQRVQYRLS